MSEKKRFFGLGYILLFCFSFVFFLYLTFPYSVLKESIVSQISSNSGLNIRVKEFGPVIPLGFEAERITISPADGGQTVELDRAEVSLSLLRLFLGQLAVDVELETPNEGSLDTQVSWGLLSVVSMVTGQVSMPGQISLVAEDFAAGQLVGFGLKLLSKQVGDMIKGTLTKIKVKGSLVGEASLKLAKNDPIQSSGMINLQLKDAVLDLNDPNLKLAPQNFEKALIKADLSGGRLNLARESGFKTQELSIDINGHTELKNPITRSLFDMGVDVTLSGTLQENFGFLLSMVGGSSENSIRYKLSGTFGRPSFRPI